MMNDINWSCEFSSMFEGTVSWKTIDENGFNRLVESLITRLYHHPPNSNVVVLDGRGGDGGIDIAVYTNGELEKIFQLKYFPEGFSGGFRSTRGKQIRKSFTAAWTNHAPPQWILVYPANPTRGELKFAKDLSIGKDVEISIMGIAQLDAELARHQDLQSMATRVPLVEALKLAAQEKAALESPSDLAQRAAGLHSLSSGRSAYWDVDFHATSQGITEILRAKHPRAAELEPLSFTFSVKKNSFGLTKDMQRVLDYGVVKDISIPGEFIEDFQMHGPDWFGQRGAVERVELIAPEPLLPAQRVPVTFELLDEQGFSTAKHEGSIHALGKGEKGISFRANFYEVVTLDAQIPSENASPGQFDLRIKFAHAHISMASKAIKFLKDISSDMSLQVSYDGRKIMKALTTAKESDNENDALLPSRDIQLLVDDLEVLENKLGTAFRMPSDLSHRERIMIRIARLLAEGRATFFPPQTSLPITLTGTRTDELTTLMTSGGVIFTTHPAFPLEIQDSKFNFGTVALYHPNVIVREAQRVREAFATSSAGGVKAHLDPQTEQLFQVFPVISDDDEFPKPVPWNLPDIPMPENYLDTIGPNSTD
ncbi:hypothetical protein [Glutamicibacter sp. NPDC087344]|uniref:hypothetical protein n=1 Tax=Glutamicibacter sp. NPDC087344 TaxID=3363994 RepID=UPI0038143B7E